MVRLLTALALCVLGVAGCGSMARRTAPPADVGVNSDITWGIAPTAQRREIRLMARAGVRWVRSTVDLSRVEPLRRGVIDLSYLHSIDRPVRAAHRAGLRVLLEFDRAPGWASADPMRRLVAGHWTFNPYWRYRRAADYAQIVAGLVRHFRRLGVSAYELWNEPNFPRFWPSGPDPAQYVQLLRATYPVVKRADPSALVVMGGLSNLGSYAYLQGMYDAGGRGLYDVANFHVYPSGDPHDCLSVADRPYVGSLCLLAGLHAVMLRNHDNVPVWVTELGWSTCSRGRSCVTPRQQARYLTAAYDILDGPGYGWIGNVFIYEMRGETPGPAWSANLDLVTSRFVVKPAYRALADMAQGRHRSGAG